MTPEILVQTSRILNAVDRCIEQGTADDAMLMMRLLREQAQRLDRHLANPRHQWNTVQTERTQNDPH